MSRTRNRQKRGGKVIAIIMAAVLSLAAGGCAGAWGVGYALTGEANPLKWTSSKPDEAPFPRTVAITNDGQPMTNGCSYDMPATGFSFLSVQNLSAETLEYVADGEITLTAELSNEYINGKFDWAADFANSSSSWAQGKVASYYVGLEPIDGGRQVKVTFLEPFAEQLILTATLQGTESAASCTIDCLKSAVMKDPLMNSSDFDDTLGFQNYVEYGVGTIKGEFVFEYAQLTLDLDFINVFKNYLNFDVTVKAYVVHQEDIEFTASEYTYQEKNGVAYDPIEWITVKYSMFIEGFDDYDQAHKDAIYYAWSRAFDDFWDYEHSYMNVFLDLSVAYCCVGVKAQTLADNDLQVARLTGSCFADGVNPSVTLNKNYVF